MKIIAWVGLVIAILPLKGITNGPDWVYYHIADTISCVVIVAWLMDERKKHR